MSSVRNASIFTYIRFCTTLYKMEKFLFFISKMAAFFYFIVISIFFSTLKLLENLSEKDLAIFFGGVLWKNFLGKN